MSRGRISGYFGTALAVVALVWGQGLDAGEHKERGYLIRNASVVLTMDPSMGVGSLGQLESVDVLILGDQIAAVGDLERRQRGVRVIDGRGMIVMPGFVDTHDHLWQSIIRGCGTDGTTSTWFGKCVARLLGPQLSESDAYAAVRLSTLAA